MVSDIDLGSEGLQRENSGEGLRSWRSVGKCVEPWSEFDLLAGDGPAIVENVWC